MQPLTIGVTGHRDIISEEIDWIEKCFSCFIDNIINEKNVKEIVILTGLASGADQIITKLCLTLSKQGTPLKVKAVLPMPISEYKNDFYGLELSEFKKNIDNIRKTEDSIIELEFKNNRDDCYVNLGTYLIDKSDILMSIWDQNINLNPGGTYQVLKQAITRDRPLPVYSIACNRKTNNKPNSNQLMSGYLKLDFNGAIVMNPEKL